MLASKIPKNLQAILWSVPIEKLNLKTDRNYIIHQVLMFGDLNDIHWLFGKYSKAEIKSVFLGEPQKVYSRESFNYIKNFVLGLNDQNILPEKYVNTLYSGT